MKILCYGDSNTYGYDPRSPFGDRYPADARWPDLLASAKATVVNAGMNGRELPRNRWAFAELERLLTAEAPDLVTVMLGTNDILNGAGVLDVCADTDTLLRWLGEHFSGLRVLLIAPVPFSIPGYAQSEVSGQLGTALEALAARRGAIFADAGKWSIPLGADGLHFTPEGHRRFAERLNEALCAIGLTSTV